MVAVQGLPRVEPETMHKILTISLPVPPSINSMYYGKTKNLTETAKEFVSIARREIKNSVQEQKWVVQGKGVWLYLDMVFYFPDRRIRDSHNCLKILLDVMQDYVYENDMYALPRIQSVEYDKENPRLEIRVSPQTKGNREKGIKVTQIVL